MLRTHTSAHQSELLRKGSRAFLATGDCYRRDEIDSTHYPVFHQMEGLRAWKKTDVDTEYIINDLKSTLEGMVRTIFGDVEMRWVDAYFPFTDPSWELEIYYNDEWLEVLGCGVVEEQVMQFGESSEYHGWAFGLGLERLAMVLFQISDIRLFWSKDERFLSQFRQGEITQFEPFSKYPPCTKDISMWVPNEEIMHVNDFCAVVRESAGDMVEKVELVDLFTHPKTGRVSKCFRITYRSLERTLTNEEVNALQESVRENIENMENIELR